MLYIKQLRTFGNNSSLRSFFAKQLQLLIPLSLSSDMITECGTKNNKYMSLILGISLITISHNNIDLN